MLPSGSSIGRKPGAWLRPLGTALLCWGILAAAAALEPHISYNRWDNFESQLAPILETNRQLTHGALPLWNRCQRLGEPLHAGAQGGMFYLPYTLCYLLVHGLGLGDGALTACIVILHMGLGALGWYLLMSALGVRPILAAVTAIGAMCGGFLTAVSSVWIFMMAVGAWLPWLAWAAIRVVEKAGRGWNSFLTAALCAVAAVGHPQMAAYAWLFAFLWGALHAALVLQKPRQAAALALPATAAALLCGPILLPAWELWRFSLRGVFTASEFASRSTRPAALAALLQPLGAARGGFLPLSAAAMPHAGFWALPAILLGALSLRSGIAAADPDRTLARSFGVAAALSVLFLIFALGQYGFIYPWTRILPVWSSFRWPFRFLLLAEALTAMCAGLGLELCARRIVTLRARRRALVATGLTLAAALACLAIGASPNLRTPAGMLTLLAGCASIPCVALAASRSARLCLLALAAASAVGLVGVCHHLGLKTYDEPFHGPSPEQRGLDQEYRVLTVSPLPGQVEGQPTALREYGLAESATYDGYRSASGLLAPLALRWYAAHLPTDLFGALHPAVLAPALDSNLLRSFNVRYMLVGKEDSAARRAVEKARGYRLVKTGGRTLLYANDSALPRDYFASGLFPYQGGAIDFSRGMLLNEAPLRSAFVDSGRFGPLPAAQVLAAQWRPHGETFTVAAPQGGFLVVSEGYYPSWTAAVDGRPAEVMRVNGALQGVTVPPGSRTVILEFTSLSLRWGFFLACMGLGLSLAGYCKGRYFSAWAKRRAAP